MEALVAIAAQIAGTSSSPEMWIAVFTVVALSNSPKRFLIALAAAAVALVGIRASLIPGYRLLGAGVIAMIALTLWSSMGWGLRVAFAKLAPQSTSDTTGQAQRPRP
jgi:hypothetical protein